MAAGKGIDNSNGIDSASESIEAGLVRGWIIFSELPSHGRTEIEQRRCKKYSIDPSSVSGATPSGDFPIGFTRHGKLIVACHRESIDSGRGEKKRLIGGLSEGLNCNYH
ncbi:unnamed protein product [Linum trigynum]|uniref:Uncharacterized protein n=1 Tax=Linum trigynum TaxID=586398 RepID=A0AAV2ER59_9ROSI